MPKRAVKHLSRFAMQVLLRFRADRCLQLASSLTFTTLLALVPLLTVMLTVVSAFPVFSGLTGQIDGFVASHVLPEQIGRTVLRYFDQFSQRAGRLTLIGLAVLAVTAFANMLTIERAFNAIWRVHYRRPLVQRIVVYWAILTLGPVLIGASLTMTSYLITASSGVARAIPFFGVLVLWLVPFALTTAAFTLLYYVVPARQIEPRDALIGGLVAGILFELAKRGFALYVLKVPSLAMVYGTFATFPIFLAWIYLSWVVIALGAVVTAMRPDYGHLLDERARALGADFCEAVEVLIALAEAHAKGIKCDIGRIAMVTRLPRERCERFLDILNSIGWVGRLEGECWALVCDPGLIVLSELFRRLVIAPGSLAAAAINPVLAVILGRLATNIDESLALTLRDLMNKSAIHRAADPES